MKKTLAKSSTDRKISGVCGGIAEYSNIDSTIIRLIFALSIIFWGFGLIIYIIAAIIMPMDYESENNRSKNTYNSQKTDEYKNEQKMNDSVNSDNRENSANESKKDFDSSMNNTNKKSNLSSAAIFGIVLVAIGIICLVNIFFPAFNYGVVFAALIVFLGVLIIIKGGR